MTKTLKQKLIGLGTGVAMTLAGASSVYGQENLSPSSMSVVKQIVQGTELSSDASSDISSKISTEIKVTPEVIPEVKVVPEVISKVVPEVNAIPTELIIRHPLQGDSSKTEKVLKGNIQYGLESNGNTYFSLGADFFDGLINAGSYNRGLFFEAPSDTKIVNSYSEKIKNQRVETKGNITKTRKDYITKTKTSQKNVHGFYGAEFGLYVEVKPQFADFGKWGRFGLKHSRGLVEILRTNENVTTMDGYSTIKFEYTNPNTGEKTTLAEERIATDSPRTFNSFENANETIETSHNSLKYNVPVPLGRSEQEISVGMSYNQAKIDSGDDKGFLGDVYNNNFWRIFLEGKF